MNVITGRFGLQITLHGEHSSEATSRTLDDIREVVAQTLCVPLETVRVTQYSEHDDTNTFYICRHKDWRHANGQPEWWTTAYHALHTLYSPRRVQFLVTIVPIQLHFAQMDPPVIRPTTPMQTRYYLECQCANEVAAVELQVAIPRIIKLVHRVLETHPQNESIVVAAVHDKPNCFAFDSIAQFSESQWQKVCRELAPFFTDTTFSVCSSNSTSSSDIAGSSSDVNEHIAVPRQLSPPSIALPQSLEQTTSAPTPPPSTEEAPVVSQSAAASTTTPPSASTARNRVRALERRVDEVEWFLRCLFGNDYPSILSAAAQARAAANSR